MPADKSSTSYKALLLADFIAKHHAALRSKGETRPLMVSMQGPQGCGKSTLAAALVEVLEATELTTAVASLDDFYLPYTGLKALAAAHPENGLLAGRGPPGTHDVPLLSSTLALVRDVNASSSAVQLPVFDKSQNEGYGDRSSSTVPVQPPVEVFLLEGWSLGFEPISPADLGTRWKAGRVASKYPLECMSTINDNLTHVSKEVHHYFDVHIGIRPKSYDYVYDWRLQQEHHMKRVNGGKGMSDEAVRAFVDRYMPCYELYGAQKVGRAGMILEFGEKREVGRIEES